MTNTYNTLITNNLKRHKFSNSFGSPPLSILGRGRHPNCVKYSDASRIVIGRNVSAFFRKSFMESGLTEY